jgi:hypothetical protein
MLVLEAALAAQPSLAATTTLSISSSSTTLTFKVAYLGTPTFVRVYVDSDQKTTTGYPLGTIGADYLIENGYLYRYAGSGGSWAWTLIKTVSLSKSSGVATWNVARSDLGSPAGINAIGNYDSVSSAVVSYTLAPVPGIINNFLFTSVPTGATVGSPFSFSVTARDASNSVIAGYTGTVHFSSSDPSPGLPADYTFSSSDKGTRQFSATLETAGNQTISVTQVAGGAPAATTRPIAVTTTSSGGGSGSSPPTATWSCEFNNGPTGCGFFLQAAASNRATIVGPGVDGPTAVSLTTEPGDANIAGSGGAERTDLTLGPSSSYCNQGQEEWWAHSVIFPPSYVMPPQSAGWNWGVVFDFHHTGSTGQPNFEIASIPGGLELNVSGGRTIVNGPTDPGYHSVAIGAVVPNVWYNFMYHIKWSSGSDGLFQAWLNGQQVMSYSGPNLYVGESCYLKLANYHTPLGVPESVIHSRVVLGTTQAAVQLP